MLFVSELSISASRIQAAATILISHYIFAFSKKERLVKSYCRKLSCLSILLLVLVFGSSQLSAEIYDSCNCNGYITRNVNICIGGDTFALAVDFCELNGSAPNYLNPVCLNSGQQNRISIIRRICFPGTRPVGYTNAQIYGYIICDIKNRACDVPNQWGFVVPNNGVYCWTFQTPKCTTTNTDGCIVACGPTCSICRTLLRWERIDGNCREALLAGVSCPANTDTCAEGCESGCPVSTCCN